MQTRFRRATTIGINVKDVTADEVYRELKKIEKEYGDLPNEVIVSEAKKKSSKLHSVFEWNDVAAAHQYRLNQARWLSRCIEVRSSNNDHWEAAFTNVVIQSETSPDNGHDEHVYVNTHRAKADDDLRRQMLYKNLRMIRSALRNVWDFDEVKQLLEVYEKTVNEFGDDRLAFEEDD